MTEEVIPTIERAVDKYLAGEITEQEYEVILNQEFEDAQKKTLHRQLYTLKLAGIEFFRQVLRWLSTGR